MFLFCQKLIFFLLLLRFDFSCCSSSHIFSFTCQLLFLSAQMKIDFFFPFKYLPLLGGGHEKSLFVDLLILTTELSEKKYQFVMCMKTQSTSSLCWLSFQLTNVNFHMHNNANSDIEFRFDPSPDTQLTHSISLLIDITSKNKQRFFLLCLLRRCFAYLHTKISSVIVWAGRM